MQLGEVLVTFIYMRMLHWKCWIWIKDGKHTCVQFSVFISYRFFFVECLKMNVCFLWKISHIVVRESKMVGWFVLYQAKKVVKLFMLKWLSKELIAQTLYVCIYCCTCIPVCDNTFEFFREKKLENYHVLNDVYPFLSINYYFFTVT